MLWSSDCSCVDGARARYILQRSLASSSSRMVLVAWPLLTGLQREQLQLLLKDLSDGEAPPDDEVDFVIKNADVLVRSPRNYY